MALPCRGGTVVVVDVVEVDDVDVDDVDEVDDVEEDDVDEVDVDVVVVGGTKMDGHDTDPDAAAGPDVSVVMTANPATANTPARPACNQRCRTSAKARENM